MRENPSDLRGTDLEVQVVDQDRLLVNVVQKAHRELVTQTKERILGLEAEIEKLCAPNRRSSGQVEGATAASVKDEEAELQYPTKSTFSSQKRVKLLSQRIRRLQAELAELEAEEVSELNEFAAEQVRSHSLATAATAMQSKEKPVDRDRKVAESPESQSDRSDTEVATGLRLQRFIYERLFPYQREALSWLWSLHVQGTGGILGDEMGLGKTIQIIAFLAALDHSNLLKGPVLIVAPVTVLDQWRRELLTWWPQVRIQVLHAVLGHGDTANQSARSQSRLVLITNYEHLRLHADWFVAKAWEYVILDEGHRIRNPEAEITQVCKRLHTVHRIIMTGAPLQNRLCELWSLFDFVYPGRLGTLQAFEEEFSIPISMGGFANSTPNQVHIAYRCAATLRDLIAPYLLRRLKREVALQLPQKQEHVLLCRMTEEQRQLYKGFLASIDIERAAAGQLNLLPIITTLRKICNHPRLAENDLHLMSSERKLVRQSESGKLVALGRLLQKLHDDEHRVLVFSQTRGMLTLLEKSFRKWNYAYLRMDGETNVSLRTQLVDRFNGDRSIFAFLLTTRVGGLGLNLIGADRVIIYDPDWNPTSDTQARERAWRIGQERPVAIYRLLTRGTIEERIYHRQIFKIFLSEKVLHDPRKRRFFKRRDIQDLLTLHEDSEDDELLELAPSASPQRMHASQERAEHPPFPDATENDQASAEVKIMRQVLDRDDQTTLSNVTAVVDHDSTLESSGKRPRTAFDREVVQVEAERIAQRAVDVLRRSVSSQATVSTNHANMNQAPWLRPPSSSSRLPASLASQTLLQRLHEREARSNDEERVFKLRQLAAEIVAYLQAEEHGITTAELARKFKQYLRDKGIDAAEFRATVRRVAYLDENKMNQRTVWRIRPSMLLSSATRAP
jgi:SNF2 family DNA or RNA helicase